MFIIIEMQKDQSGNVAITPAIQREDENEAYSEYFRVASIAAVSSIPRHSVILLEDNGFPREFKSFEHQIYE